MSGGYIRLTELVADLSHVEISMYQMLEYWYTEEYRADVYSAEYATGLEQIPRSDWPIYNGGGVFPRQAGHGNAELKELEEHIMPHWAELVPHW